MGQACQALWVMPMPPLAPTCDQGNLNHRTIPTLEHEWSYQKQEDLLWLKMVQLGRNHRDTLAQQSLISLTLYTCPA